MAKRRKTTEDPATALARIQSMQFGPNDVAVIVAFSECGIDPENIDPRHNVLTFNAWKAKGRRVGKGAISQRVTVWIPTGKDSDEPAEPPKDGEKPKRSGMRPTTARLFHESQTVAADAEKGTRPDAWQNPALVREGTYEAEEEAEAVAPVAHVPQWMADAFGMEEKPGHVEITPEPVGDCSCPMVGVITNVDCPIHGEMVTA